MIFTKTNFTNIDNSGLGLQLPTIAAYISNVTMTSVYFQTLMQQETIPQVYFSRSNVTLATVKGIDYTQSMFKALDTTIKGSDVQIT